MTIAHGLGITNEMAEEILATRFTVLSVEVRDAGLYDVIHYIHARDTGLLEIPLGRHGVRAWRN